MNFNISNAILYSDTLVPDIFIAEYMPSTNGDFIKVYLYCLFLAKHNKTASLEELCKKLDISKQTVKDALTYWENLKILSYTDNNISIVDLKEKEIHKMFSLKTSSSPEDAAHSSERNKKRNQIVSAINNAFFQGLMSPSWYTDIDAWFNRFRFEEDVMYSLFSHCYSHKGLYKNYILKVAENWHNRGIINNFDLEKYSEEYQKFRDVKIAIVKKLKLGRNLTEYEEQLVEKWVIDYGYCLDIIELALKKTTARTNPNFDFLDNIIGQWHTNDLKSTDDITAYESKRKAACRKEKPDKIVPAYKNYEQRKYGQDYDDSMFDNLKQ